MRPTCQVFRRLQKPIYNGNLAAIRDGFPLLIHYIILVYMFIDFLFVMESEWRLFLDAALLPANAHIAAFCKVRFFSNRFFLSLSDL